MKEEGKGNYEKKMSEKKTTKTLLTASVESFFMFVLLQIPSCLCVCVCVCVGCSLPFFSSTRVGMRIAREKNVPETFGSARARKKKQKGVNPVSSNVRRFRTTYIFFAKTKPRRNAERRKARVSSKASSH